MCYCNSLASFTNQIKCLLFEKYTLFAESGWKSEREREMSSMNGSITAFDDFDNDSKWKRLKLTPGMCLIH